MTDPLQPRAQGAALIEERIRDLRALLAGDGSHELPLALQEPSAHLSALYSDILALLEQTPVDGFALDSDGPLAIHLRGMVAEQVRAGQDAREILGFLQKLKPIFAKRAKLSAPADPSWVDQVFDQVMLLSFTIFLDIRERLITQQSLSLLELSTPVLRLWNRVLLLPLVGVIDTVRARQITERLLEAIARHEARVTILDLTGVPVLDTSVAQHLMKTIDAARLLGTRIVMTGISPEGAQTLTKLGIRFADVISRASLRAGIAEALLMVGQRIAPLKDARP